MSGGGPPSVIALAGPNGAGKTTAATALLRDAFGIPEILNADIIAQDLAAVSSRAADARAGRILLQRFEELAGRRKSFALETTFAGRALGARLRRLRKDGYCVQVLFLWLPSADLAVARVADRVRLGGHDVPEPTVRSRYRRGLQNLLGIYRPLAATWQLWDSSARSPQLVAFGEEDRRLSVVGPDLWAKVLEGAQPPPAVACAGPDPGMRLSGRGRIEAALARAAREAADAHRRQGLPLVIWEQGRLAWVPPRRLPRAKRRSLQS